MIVLIAAFEIIQIYETMELSLNSQFNKLVETALMEQDDDNMITEEILIQRT